MTNIVSFQLFGTNRLATLEMLPTQPSEHAANRVLNQLNMESRRANLLSQCGVGCDDRLPFGGADKLFPAQQPFTVHACAHGFRAEIVVANIDVTATGIERRESPGASRTAALYRFQQRDRNDWLLQYFGQSFNGSQSHAQSGKRTG